MRFLREYWFEIACCLIGALVGLGVAWASENCHVAWDCPPQEVRVWGVGD